MRAALLLHGFLTDDKDFGKLKHYIKKRYDLISSPVFPGHTKPNDFSLFNEADTIKTAERAFDELKSKYDEVDVYGFSMGGAIATYLAKTREVSRLILLAPANKYLNFRMGFERFRYQFKLLNNSVKWSGGKKDLRNASLAAVKTFYANEKTGIKLLTKQLLPNYNFHTLSAFAKVIKTCNENLTTLKPQTLIIWGKLDEFVPKESYEFLQDMFENNGSRVKVFENLGHLMLLSKNDKEVIDEIIAFLDER